MPITHSLCVCLWSLSLPVLPGHLHPLPSRSFNPAKWVPSSYLKHALCFCFLKCPGFFVKVHMAFFSFLQDPVQIPTLPFYFKAFHGCSQQEAVTSLIFALIFVVVFSCAFLCYFNYAAGCLRLEFEICIFPSEFE